MKNKYSATIIGLIFTLFSLISILLFAIPIISIIPIALPLELIFSNFVNDKYLWISVTISLLIIFILTSNLLYRKIKDNISNRGFILYLTLQFFVLHPLVFYIKLSSNWARASDGQVMFMIVESFPYSSWTFLILGILTDIFRHQVQKKLNEL